MIQFRGTRKEFGEYYGLRLKEFRHNFFRHTNADTLRRQLKIYEKFYPELVQENLPRPKSSIKTHSIYCTKT